MTHRQNWEQQIFLLSGIRHIITNKKFYCQQNRTVCFRVKNTGCVDKFKTIRSWCHFCIHPIARISCHPIQDLARIQHLVLQIRELQGITRHSFLPGFFSQNFRPISEVDFGHNISAQFCPNLSSISAQFKRLGAKMQDALFFCDT